jgi:hypothetical protein
MRCKTAQPTERLLLEASGSNLAAPLEGKVSMRGFDLRTALITFAATPIAFFVVRKIVAFLKANLGRVLDAFFWIANRKITKSIAVRMSLRHYCKIELAKTETKFLHVPGRHQMPLLTDEIYVPLKLEHATKAASADLDDLWSDGVSRVQVIGDPGSGKSSLVKRLFRNECAKNLDEIPDARLPVLVELKAFLPPARLKADASIAAWAMKELRNRVMAVTGYDMAALFDASVTDTGLLVLLDGLDEVPTEFYERVGSAIEILAEKLANDSDRNRIVLTMRTQFYQQVRDHLAQTFAQVFHVQPFTPSDVYDFLLRWPFKSTSTTRQLSINRIFADLTDRPTLREMCTNPLILAMFVARNQSGEGVGSPETRTEFYSQVVEELVIARRGRQLDLKHRGSLRRTRERLLGRIAYENLTRFGEPANLIEWKHALDITIKISGCANREDAAKILREICKETGLLTEEKVGETLRFVHLTFCEFFTAKDAVEDRPNGWNELLALHKQQASTAGSAVSRLVEVLPFMVGMMTRVNAVQAISEIVPLLDSPLSGKAFLETQAYDHPDWNTYATEESQSLIGVSPECWDDSWLRRLHLLNVVLVDEQAWRASQLRPPKSNLSLDKLFSDLVQNDKSRLIRLFKSYTTVDPQAAYRLARACGLNLIADEPLLVAENLDSPPFYSIIVHEISNDSLLRQSGAAIILEGALASRAVASQAARDSPAILSCGMDLRTVRRDCRWYLLRPPKTWYQPLELSLLTLAATIVAIEGTPSGGYFPRVQLSQDWSNPPGSYWWFRFARVGRGTAILLGGILLLAYATASLLYGRASGNLWLFAIGVASAYLTLPVVMHGALYPSTMARVFDDFLYPPNVDVPVLTWYQRLRRPGYLFAGRAYIRMLQLRVLVETADFTRDRSAANPIPPPRIGEVDHDAFANPT